jgi:hypothetical protein
MAFWSVFVGHGFAPALTDIQSLICDEAAVALSLLYRGRNIGALLGLPPAEHEVVLPMVFICHIRAGCIQRAELYYNAGTLLRQLGLGL